MIKIEKKDLPQRKHCDFLDENHLKSIVVYDFVTEMIIKEILSLMKEEGLTKSESSDTEKAKSMIKIPFNKLNRAIEKRLNVIKWMFFGKMAGKKVEQDVEELRVKSKVPAGIVYSSFLDSLDSQRKYLKALDSKSDTDISNMFMKIFFDSIKNKSKQYVESNLTNLKNSIVQSVSDTVNQFNQDNLARLSEGKPVKAEIESVFVKKNIRESVDKFSKKYDTLVSTETSMASSVGAYVAGNSIFDEEDVKVAIVSVRDDRCCDSCERLSRNKDGSLIIYKPSELKPVGYNFKKPKREWEPSVPSFHPNCRCNLVYIPKGFTIDKDGAIWPRSQNEDNTTDKS